MLVYLVKCTHSWRSIYLSINNNYIANLTSIIFFKIQDIESYNFIEGMRDHLESFVGDVIVTHANAGEHKN